MSILLVHESKTGKAYATENSELKYSSEQGAFILKDFNAQGEMLESLVPLDIATDMIAHLFAITDKVLIDSNESLSTYDGHTGNAYFEGL